MALSSQPFTKFKFDSNTYWVNFLMQKIVRVGTQESVTYYTHAVDLAFAITVWKCQGGTFDYTIALLEQTPGSPTLTFEKLYVMFQDIEKIKLLSVGVVVRRCRRPLVSSSVCKDFLPK